MSYGVWKKRGKNWSSIVIDGMGRDATWQWEQYANWHGKPAAESKKRSYQKLGLGCGASIYDSSCRDDYYWLQWAANQKKKGFVLYEVLTGSDHAEFFAVPRDAGEAEIADVLQKLNRVDKQIQRL
jgi:hypothetical protein